MSARFLDDRHRVVLFPTVLPAVVWAVVLPRAKRANRRRLTHYVASVPYYTRPDFGTMKETGTKKTKKMKNLGRDRTTGVLESQFSTKPDKRRTGPNQCRNGLTARVFCATYHYRLSVSWDRVQG